MGDSTLRKLGRPGTDDILEALPPDTLLDVLPVNGDRLVAEVLPVPDEPDVLDVVPVGPPQPTLPIVDLPVAQVPVPVSSRSLLGLLGRICLGLIRAMIWLIGVVTLIGGLAVLAAIPVLQFLSLGYLLEAGGRIARTGKLRNGFPGVRKAALIGIIVLGTWLMLLPLRLLSSMAVSAQLIDPDGAVVARWKIGLTVATIAVVGFIIVYVLVVSRIAAAIYGGKRRPGGYYARARDAVYDFVMSLRLPYYFWLGLRGFIGAFVWLVVPVTMLAVSRQLPLVGFLGAVLLAVVLLYVPFLQMRFAAENRLRAMFEFGAIRNRFKRAPWAFTIALFFTLLFALPLYLLKIEMIPSEAAWLPSLIFIIFIFPARLLTGWAIGRAEKRPTPRHWFFRWTAWLPMLPMTGLYVFFLFFTQYAVWQGVWSFYEQHAFLLPVPFMGM